MRRRYGGSLFVDCGKLKLNYHMLGISNKKTTILSSNLVFAACFLVMGFFGGMISLFGKDYLIDFGRMVFVVCFVLFLLALAVMFLRMQAKIQFLGTELRRTAEEESFGRVKMLTLINSMKDSIILLDSNGYVTDYNAATLDLFNTNIDIIRHPAINVFKPVNVADFDLETILKDLTGYKKFNFTNITKDGERIDLEVSISRAKSGYGSFGVRGFIVVARRLNSDSAKLKSDGSDARLMGQIENALMLIKKGNVGGAKKVLEEASRND
jgi:PAS domain-containing protein